MDTLNSITAVSAPRLPGLGLRVDGTNFLHNGQRFRGIGVNHFSLLLRQLYVVGPAVDYVKDINDIKALHIPFVRFSDGFYDANGWVTYWKNNKTAYFAAFDSIVAAAEQAGIGLIPSLFWSLRALCDATYTVYGSLSTPQSLKYKMSGAWALAQEFIVDVVSRYKNSPAIWGWEVCNEAVNNAGPEYYSTWPMDGTGVDAGGVPLTFVNWGTKPGGGSYAASDKLSMYGWLEFSRNAVELINQLDGHGRFVSSGSAIGNSFAMTAQTVNGLSADTLAMWNTGFYGIPWVAYHDYHFPVVCSHIYPQSTSDNKFFPGDEKTDSQMILLYKGWCDQVKKPFYLGEWGASLHDTAGPTIADEQAHFYATLDTVMTGDIQLSSVWNYGGTVANGGWEYFALTDPSRKYQLDALSAANVTLGN